MLSSVFNEQISPEKQQETGGDFRKKIQKEIRWVTRFIRRESANGKMSFARRSGLKLWKYNVFRFMRIFFQRRHIVGHSGGLSPWWGCRKSRRCRRKILVFRGNYSRRGVNFSLPDREDGAHLGVSFVCAGKKSAKNKKMWKKCIK